MDRQQLIEQLRGCVAELLNTPQADIDEQTPLESYGLDSLAAAGLSGQLSDWLGIELSADVVYECATIASISEFVCALLPGNVERPVVENPAH